MPTLTKSKPKGTKTVPANETFGQRVKRLRMERGMESPSDLARMIWGTRTDGRGFEVANNRDTIWRYENDKSAPSRKNLALLSQALGVPENELYPEGAKSVRMIDVLECRIIDRTQQKYRLVVDLELDGSTADKVFGELREWLRENPNGPPVRIVTAEEVVAAPLPGQKKAAAPARKPVAKKAPAKAPAKKAKRK